MEPVKQCPRSQLRGDLSPITPNHIDTMFNPGHLDLLMTALTEACERLEFLPFQSDYIDLQALRFNDRHAKCCGAKMTASIGRCLLETITILKITSSVFEADGKQRGPTVTISLPYEHKGATGAEAAKFEMKAINDGWQQCSRIVRGMEQ